jgi:hypothetical protein
MPLDMFEREAAEGDTDALRRSGTQLPATFSEGFSADWNDAFYFQMSVSEENARRSAIGDYADEIYQRTGDAATHPAAVSGDVEGLNRQIERLNGERPELGIALLSEDVIQRKAEDISRTARRERGDIAKRGRTAGGVAGSALGSILGTVADPVNVVAFPLAAPESLGILATTVAWGLIGGGTQTAIELAGSSYREKVEPGYNESGAPAANLLGATAFAGATGGVLKGIVDVWKRYKTGVWPRSVRDAGNIAESEANIADTNIFRSVEGETAHRTALQKAIDDTVGGRPVEVDSVVTPSLLANYNERLYGVMNARTEALRAGESALRLEREGARLPGTMERLSEVQLGEIAATGRAVAAEGRAAGEALTAEGESIAAGRTALQERSAGIDTLRQEAESLRSDLLALQERAATARPAGDPITQARLAAIDTDLSAPGLTAARRAELSAEKTSITSTLAATAKQDGRLAASLAQESKGLEIALARKSKAVERAEASAAKEEAKIAQREQRLPGRQSALEARTTSRQAAADKELRRAVSRLAEDGYGIRLPREDAEAFAARIAGAADTEADTVLRGITETLVDRAMELRRAEAELPGIGKPAPAFEQRTRAQRHTEEMRKQITALAREVGYEMPREEAAAIAQHIAHLSENDALAVLDEVMLRPRTIAETLPGASTFVNRGTRSREIEGAPVQVRAAMAAEMTPAKIEAARMAPETEETVLRNLDRLRAERGDVQIPVGETIDAEGKAGAVMRSVEDAIAEAESRQLAAKEIMDCVGPYPQEVQS